MPVLTPATGPIQVNSVATNINSYSSITALRDGSGRYVIAYERLDNSSNLLFGRIYEADGTSVGTEFAIGTNVARRIAPSIAALPNGEFVVAFTDFADPTLGGTYVSRFTAEGALIRTVRVDDPSNTFRESLVTVRALGDEGGYIVTFSLSEVYGVIADENDQLSGRILLSAPDLASDSQSLASTAVLAGGGFVTAWASQPTPNPQGAYGAAIEFQRFDDGGSLVGSPITVIEMPAADLFIPYVYALTDGRFVVIYGGEFSSDGEEVAWWTARIFTAAGVPDSPPIPIQSGTGTLQPPEVLALPGGGFVIASGQADATNAGTISLQAYDSNGNPLGLETIAATGNPAFLGDLNLALLDDGSIILSWDTIDAGGNDGDVFMRRFTVDLGDVEPAAQNDALFTDENTTVTGSLTANDTNAGNVTAINGNPANVGVQIALASGALLTVNADGSYSYDPNGAYQNLSSDGPNGTGYDSFTYSTATGGEADVLITITGILVPGEPYVGTAGDDIIADENYNFFDLSQGGDDSAYGSGSNDGFFLGAAFNGDDAIDGGGGHDELGLQGSISLFLSSTSIRNIETIALLSSSDSRFATDTTPNSYNLIMDGLNVAAGATLTVNGNGLLLGENFSFSGLSETNGSFILYGGFGTENLGGGSQNDGFFFGPGRFDPSVDRVNGRGGTDDQLGLRGDYSAGLTFLAATMTNVETVALISSQDPRYGPLATPFSYSLTFDDGNVAAGAQLTVTGAGLLASETLIANGAAETNGFFRMIGGAAGDTLVGGAGDDSFWGGFGADMLDGNGGNNRYIYTDADESTAAATDQLFDFDSGDLIDVTMFDANALTAGDQDFDYIGSGAFNAAGQLRAVDLGGGQWRIEGNTDADLDAELVILVTTQGDFTFSDAAFTGLVP